MFETQQKHKAGLKVRFPVDTDTERHHGSFSRNDPCFTDPLAW